jgi:hypothetical protein
LIEGTSFIASSLCKSQLGRGAAALAVLTSTFVGHVIRHDCCGIIILSETGDIVINILSKLSMASWNYLSKRYSIPQHGGSFFSFLFSPRLMVVCRFLPLETSFLGQHIA